MNVLVIGRALPEQSSGMIGTFELGQARALAKVGCASVYGYVDFRSVKSNRRYGRGISLDVDGIPVVGVGAPLRGLPAAIIERERTKALISLFERAREKTASRTINVVYAHFPLLTLTQGFLDYLATRSTPLVVLEHWSHVLNKTLNPIESRLLASLVFQSKRFMCVSQDLADAVCDLTGCPSDAILVVPNMVSHEVFHPAQADGNPKRSDAPRRDGARSDAAGPFVAVGRLVPEKRYNMLIEAYALAFPQHERRLVIVGEGKLHRRLASEIRLRGLGGHVSLLGFKKPHEVANLLRGACGYVSASGIETFGVPFVEAWMCGTPCVGADTNPLRTLFSDRNGVLFEVDSVRSLADALRTLAQRDESYDRMAISAEACRMFSEESVIERVSMVLQSSLEL